MLPNNTLLHRADKLLSILLISLVITACDIEIINNVPDVPPEGRYLVVNANQHSGTAEVQAAISLFEDATPVKLVGGDVVQVSTTNDSILLLNEGFYNGSYAASLPNAADLNQIEFLMVHEPIEARQGRWYPVDLLNIDPGPGEFVGASASITLPPEPLNVATSSNNFISIDESFIITWVAESANDIIKIRSAISCSNNNDQTYTYGTEAALTDELDNGTKTIGLDQFIYDINNTTPPPFEFLLDENRAALQELLNNLSDAGLSLPFFDNLEIINPIKSSCEIRLFLFRQRDGAFDSSATNGRIYGSRSAEVTLTYNPN